MGDSQARSDYTGYLWGKPPLAPRAIAALEALLASFLQTTVKGRKALGPRSQPSGIVDLLLPVAADAGASQRSPCALCPWPVVRFRRHSHGIEHAPSSRSNHHTGIVILHNLISNLHPQVSQVCEGCMTLDNAGQIHRSFKLQRFALARDGAKLW